MFRTSYLLLCLVAATQQVQITQFEVPDTAKVGDNVLLKCELQGKEDPAFELKWWWTPVDTGSSQKKTIYQRLYGRKGVLSSGFPDINIKEGDSLELVNAQPRHSGEYECHLTTLDDGDTKLSDDLLIYSPGTGPLLNLTTVADSPDDNDTIDDILVTCEAFGVTPEPELVISSEEGEISDFNEDKKVSMSGFYNASLSVTLTNLTHESVIYCKMSYKVDFKVSESEIDLFEANVTYNAPGGAEATTTEAEEITSEQPTTASYTDGGCSIGSSWTLWLLAALGTQLLVQY